MPITFDKLFRLLEEQGYTTYRIRKEKLIGQATYTHLRNDPEPTINTTTIANLCKALHCQPGDLMEYVPEPEEKEDQSNV